MLNMTKETREFLHANFPEAENSDNLNDVLDKLDDMMTDSLTNNYEPTEKTRQIELAYDDLYANN